MSHAPAGRERIRLACSGEPRRVSPTSDRARGHGPGITRRPDRSPEGPSPAWQTVVKRPGRWPRAALPSTSCSRPSPRFLPPGHVCALDPRWFTLAVAAEVAHFACTFAPQRLALRTKAWFPVITSQLAGNAITLIVPGVRRWVPPCSSGCWRPAGGTPARPWAGRGGLLPPPGGGLLALPVFPALPVILVGAPTNRGLVNAAILGRWGSWPSPRWARSSSPTTRRCAGVAGRYSGCGIRSCARGPR